MGSILPASPHPTGWHSLGPRGIPLPQISPTGEKETRRTSTAFTTEGPKSSHHHHGHLQLSPPRTSVGRAAHSPCHCVLPKQELFPIPLRARCATPFPFSPYSPPSPGATAWVSMPPDTGIAASLHIPVLLALTPRGIPSGMTGSWGGLGGWGEKRPGRSQQPPLNICSTIEVNLVST